MSLDASRLQRATSPASSGRSSPKNPRPRFAAEDASNKKDKNYRRYASAVERALSLFDTALQEWADYISFLARLLKALQLRPSAIAEIPHKPLVARRLAQCLSPSLPSGVHQKTMEVYAYIFNVLGPVGLARDLALYLPGLSPALSYASLSVRPAVLSLFEIHILAIDQAFLRPALKAIILSLLPGLEEQNSHEFERTHSILLKLRTAIGQSGGIDSQPRDMSSDQFYWQCLFLASITSTSRRQGALAFMVRNLPQLGNVKQGREATGHHQSLNKGVLESMDEPLSTVEAVISPEPGLLVRSFAAGLRDEQLLIQRNFLDLLVTHLPIHSDVLQRKTARDDLDRLVGAAASVVTRREMSLNRRLWTWFLGPEPTAESQPSTPLTTKHPSPSIALTPLTRPQKNHHIYFERYSLDALVRTILKMVQTDSVAPSEKARPFRICLSLMDRWEIGGMVVPQILLPLLQNVWQYQSIAPSQDSFEEVFRSASVLFDGIEAGLIWGEISRVLTSSFGNREALDDNQDGLGLIFFIITRFNIRDEEMQTTHIPVVTLLTVIYLQNDMRESVGQGKIDPTETEHMALKIALSLLDLIPERAFEKGLAAPSLKVFEEGIGDFAESSQEYLKAVQTFYGQFQGNIDQAGIPLSSENIGQLLLHNIVQLILQQLRRKRQARCLEMQLSLLEKITQKIIKTDGIDRETCLQALVDALESVRDHTGTPTSIETITTVISAMEVFLIALPSEIWHSSYQIRRLITDLVTNLWPWLSPSKPSNNVEAVRCIWRLQMVFPDTRFIEACIATLMIDDCKLPAGEGALEGARRFTTLWTHSSSSINSLQSRHSSLSRSTRLGLASQTKSIALEMVVLERPLMLLLDSLSEPAAEISRFTSNWLQSLPALHVIVQLLLNHLRTSKLFVNCSVFSSTTVTKPALYDLSDLEECQYLLQTMSNLVVGSPENIWASLTMEEHQPDNRQASAVESIAVPFPNSGVNDEATIQAFLIRACLTVLQEHPSEGTSLIAQASALRRVAATLLQHMLPGQSSVPAEYSTMEDTVIVALNRSVRREDSLLQVDLMHLLVIVMRTRLMDPKAPPRLTQPGIFTSDNTTQSLPRLSVSAEANEIDDPSAAACPPSPALLDCLLLGLSSPGSYPVLDHWVRFLDECLPFYAENAFHILMPLVECFNKTIRAVSEFLRATFEGRGKTSANSEPLVTLHSLLHGLERSLARAHERLLQDEAGTISLKAPEQSQGFFGNMVSGVFAPELSKSKRTTANNRLTVLLCFKDAIHVCLDIWTWASHGQSSQARDLVTSASLNYTSVRMKNRTRRILEHLFAAEALECLETLVQIWHQARDQGDTSRSVAVFNLLHVLDGSRPRNIIPALFNAMYSRTNPNALEPGRKSSLTADISENTLADFLVRYMRSLEDDAMDEIWTDCMTFLKDVLANPLPQRQTLPRLLEFTAVLGEKVNNTTFGEQRRMRRDLGDLFVRLLAATFTAKPLTFAQDDGKPAASDVASASHVTNPKQTQSDDIVGIVALLLPKLSKILVDTDRVAAASSIISLQILTPTIQSRAYPQTASSSTLRIFLAMSRIPEASKIWRKVVAEAFNDPRFFCTRSLSLAEEGWVPVLRQWALLDKDRMQDYLSRMVPPTAAGIMFGVGASSARIEADRKTQLILRRMTLLVLAAADDAYVTNLVAIQVKVLELLTATAASSPSSATRAEIYMLLRALVLKISAVHMASFWPLISSELYEALSSLFPGEQHETYNVHSILQACKLLDTLVTLAPDEFQLREWLFVTDTVDAVYRPHAWSPVALVDELAEDLDSYSGGHDNALSPTIASVAPVGKRKPLLSSEVIRDICKEDIVDRVLKPFFRQLSINAFESTYSMVVADWKACHDILLDDLFDDSTLA